jgi:hypothetical protein
MVENNWPAYEQVKNQLRDYLLGSLSTGLLLMGNRGLPMLDDAMKIASSLLSADNAEGHPDFLFITLGEKEQSIGVDEVEPILQKASLFPSIAQRSVIVIDNFDKVTVQAQNKLLKLIEESVTAVIIGVCYEDLVLQTIKSRMRVINYQPMDKSTYMACCGIDDKTLALASYFVSGGIIGSEMDEELFSFFKNVAVAINCGNLHELMPALGMLEEKSASSFYKQYRNYVGSMISFIGQLLVDNRKFDLIGLLSEHKDIASSSRYTQDDFFALITELVEGGKQ